MKLGLGTVQFGLDYGITNATGKTPVGTIIYTSSTSVYPQGNGAVVDETSAADGAIEGSVSQGPFEAAIVLRRMEKAS